MKWTVLDLNWSEVTEIYKCVRKMLWTIGNGES